MGPSTKPRKARLAICERKKHKTYSWVIGEESDSNSTATGDHNDVSPDGVIVIILKGRVDLGIVASDVERFPNQSDYRGQEEVS